MGSTSPCGRVGGEILVTPAGATAVALAWDADHYLMAYVDPTSGLGDVVTQRLAPDGSSIGAKSVVEASPGGAGHPALVKTKAGWLAIWQDGPSGAGSVRARPLDPGGAPSGAAIEIAKSSAKEVRPTAVATAKGVVGAWMDTSATFGAVRLATLGDDGVPAPPSAVGLATADAVYPSLASGPSGDVVVWSDKRAGQLDTRLRFITGTDEIALRSGVDGDALLPRVAPLPAGFAVAWEDTRGSDEQAYVAWTDAAGKKLGDAVVEQEQGSTNWPRPAALGSRLAVVYYQFRTGKPEVYVALFDDAMARVGDDAQISMSTKSARFPEVAVAGSDLGVAWVDTRSGAQQAYFARVACK